MRRIIVTGPGFAGTNAVIRLLEKTGVYIGNKFLDYPKDQHPYPVKESTEWNNIVTKARQGHSDTLQQLNHLIEKWDKQTDYAWAWKSPNNFTVLPLLVEYIPNVLVITCSRKRSTLTSRWMERWKYSKKQCNDRYLHYLAVVENIMLRQIPTITVEQEWLKENNEEFKIKISKTLQEEVETSS